MFFSAVNQLDEDCLFSSCYLSQLVVDSFNLVWSLLAFSALVSVLRYFTRKLLLASFTTERAYTCVKTEDIYPCELHHRRKLAKVFRALLFH